MPRRAPRGMDTDARRDLQRSATGKDSCADMTVDELRSVIRAMGTPRDRLAAGRGRGQAAGAVDQRLASRRRARPHGRGSRRMAAPPDRAGDGGLDRPPAGLARAIEALKLWLAREAGVDWAPLARIDRHGRTHECDHPPRPRPGGAVAHPAPSRRGGDRRTRVRSRPMPRAVSASGSVPSSI